MNGWMVQRYATWPLFWNPTEKCPPLPSSPLSNEPSSAATSWPKASEFFQVTVSPTRRVVEAGSKNLPGMSTTCSAARAGVAARARPAAARGHQRPSHRRTR